MSGRRAFFLVRVFALLGILAIVLVYAWRDLATRRERLRWDRPVACAIILVRAGPVSDAALAALEARVPALEDVLREEMGRYRKVDFAPFELSVLGPVEGAAPPPPPTEPGLGAALEYAWSAWQYRRTIDHAGDVLPRAYDSRVYVAVVPSTNPEQRFVEGFGENGGRVGYVVVQLDESMVDLALAVVTHELFHTLGAQDRYDEQGRTRVPEGLVEPDRNPLYPQPRADIMGHGLLLGPSEERLPESVTELGVGEVTARELRWLE